MIWKNKKKAIDYFRKYEMMQRFAMTSFDEDMADAFSYKANLYLSAAMRCMKFKNMKKTIKYFKRAC